METTLNSIINVFSLLFSCRFLSEFTGMEMEKVEEECDRENFLGPKQAIELGIIDGIIE
jgi:ATP-dependent protease ClpP protease subunit